MKKSRYANKQTKIEPHIFCVHPIKILWLKDRASSQVSKNSKEIT